MDRPHHHSHHLPIGARMNFKEVHLSLIFYIIAIVCFLLEAFGATVGVPLIPIGLASFAAGHIVP